VIASFSDASGTVRRFEDKHAIFVAEHGAPGVRCEVIGLIPGRGEDRFLVDTARPDHVVELDAGETRFVVTRDQLVCEGEEPSCLKVGTLRQALADWTDVDVAQHALAQCLGLMASDLPPLGRATRHVYWTENPVGRALHDMLEALRGASVLEAHPDDPTVLRWNAAFRGSWESERQGSAPSLPRE
jgi:hypothetical protein